MRTLKRHKAKTTRETATWLPWSKRSLISLGIIMLFIIAFQGDVLSQESDSPRIAQYTAYPPFGGTILKPNVLINLDTSMSTLYFAYDFNYNARTATGATMGNMTDAPVSQGFVDDPDNPYYGYFDNKEMYQYRNNEFRVNTDGQWSGNFLNWLTMRRVDIIKKVLIGGKTRERIGLSGHAHDLLAQTARGHHNSLLGSLKYISNAGPYTPLTGAQTFVFDNNSSQDEGQGGGQGGGQGQGNVNVTDIAFFKVGVSTYYIVVHRDTKPEGVLQGAGNSIRWGLEFMNGGTGKGRSHDDNGCGESETGKGGGMGGGGNGNGGGGANGGGNGGGMGGVTDVAGGSVVVPVGYGKINAIVSEVAKMLPETPFTPIAESLWTATGYFRQKSQTGNFYGRYTTSSYPVGDSVDPYNYALNPGTEKKWVPCANSFVITITDGEPTADLEIPWTQQRYGPTYADGENEGPVPNWADTTSYNNNDPLNGLLNYFWDPGLNGSHYVDNVALWGHVDYDITKEYRDLRSESYLNNTYGPQYLTSYFIYANFGSGSPDGRRLLNWPNTGPISPNPGNDSIHKYAGGAARNGGFIDNDGNFVPDQQSEYDADEDGNNDTFFEAENGYQLEAALLKALYDIIYNNKKSGTASAIAGTRGGEGTIYQAYFYPGINSTDTNPDNITVTGERRWLGFIGAFSVDAADGNLTQLWEAGKKLWERDPSTRKIYTTIDGSTFLEDGANPAGFTTNNKSTLKDYLRAEGVTNTEREADAAKIIDYIRGVDKPGYRPRTVSIASETCEGSSTTCPWKLGDIVYSSPTPAGAPMERYDRLYMDATYARFYNKYKNKSTVVYAGANDGMLHAFSGGYYCPDSSTPPVYKFYDIWTDNDTDNIIDPGECSNTANLGREMWAFIPKQLLPHLKWLTDTNYTHVYYVDLKPKVTDAQIFTEETACADPNASACVHPDGWGTILIGGMRFGGKHIQWTSGGNDYETFSAYFALDITDSSNPRLLWTFTDSNLGLTTSYPAIARVKVGSTDRWVMIAGSGPDGFDGGSNVSNTRTGKVFVVDLVTGSLLKTFNLGTLNLNTNNTFMADPITIDVSLDYKVDVAYIGDADGNMYRLVTKNSTDVADWTLSTLISTAGTKQITSAPSAALDGSRNLWVYFGTGKFIGSDDKLTTDAQAFYGVKDICKPWTPVNGIYPSCSGYTVTDPDDLYNASTTEVTPGDEKAWTEITTAAGASAIKGWKINFPSVPGHDTATVGNGERSLAKPLVVGGLVIFTTYIPEDNLCSTEEGNAYLWAVYYKTGTAWKEYVFSDEIIDKPDTVGREKSLGKGFATVTATVTKAGGLKTFASTLLGENFTVEVETPLNLTSGLKGWSPQCGE